jgi:hypothetical protein
VWVEVTASYFAFLDFRADPDGIECLRIPTGTDYEKLRAITALRSAADFLVSKLDKSGEVLTNARILQGRGPANQSSKFLPTFAPLAQCIKDDSTQMVKDK